MPPAASDPSCVFCKIAAGQIPCFRVFDDDAIIAFLDIGPIVTGHTLIIPKAHHATIMETPPEVLAAINLRIPAIARAVLAATGAPACHILTNNGREAMQSVPHLHYHILPRAPGDGFHIPWNAGTLEKNAGAALAQAVQAKLHLPQ